MTWYFIHIIILFAICQIFDWGFTFENKRFLYYYYCTNISRFSGCEKQRKERDPRKSKKEIIDDVPKENLFLCKVDNNRKYMHTLLDTIKY